MNDGPNVTTPESTSEINMTQLKHIGHFDHLCDDIGIYLEKLEHYFHSNDINDKAKQTAIFLTVIGKRTYSLLRKLLAPELPTSKTMEVLTEKLKDYLGPKPNVVAERYRFYCRNQKDNETVDMYVCALRMLTSNCDFGTFLCDVLRDKFICGLKDLSMRDHLLTQNNTLTLGDAVDIGKQFERTKPKREKTKEKENKDAEFTPGPKTIENRKCYRCNSKYHVGQTCRFKEVVCHKCNVVGHLGTACVDKFRTGGELNEEENEHNVKERLDNITRPFTKVNSVATTKCNLDGTAAYDERHDSTHVINNEAGTNSSESINHHSDSNAIYEQSTHHSDRHPEGTKDALLTSDSKALKCHSCRRKGTGRPEKINNIFDLLCNNEAHKTARIERLKNSQTNEPHAHDTRLSDRSPGTCAEGVLETAETLKRKTESREPRTENNGVGKDGDKKYEKRQSDESCAPQKAYNTERLKHLFNLMYNNRAIIREPNSTEGPSNLSDCNPTSKEPETISKIMKHSLRSNYALQKYLGSWENVTGSDLVKQPNNTVNAYAVSYDSHASKEPESDHSCNTCSYCTESLEKGIQFLTDTSCVSAADKHGTPEESATIENGESHANNNSQHKKMENTKDEHLLSESGLSPKHPVAAESSLVYSNGSRKDNKTSKAISKETDSDGERRNDEGISGDNDDNVRYVTTQVKSEALEVTVTVESQQLKFNINTGSPVSIISDMTYYKHFSTNKMFATNVVLKTYDDVRIPVIGKLNVMVEHYGMVYPKLKLYVVSGNDINMLGRDWLNEIKLDWSSLFSECLGAYKDKQHQVS